MKKDMVLKEIVDNAKVLMGFKTIKDNYSEFDKALEVVKNELSNYYVKEYVVNNYKNLVISNTKEKDLDVMFCCHIDVVPAEKYEGIVKDGKLYGRGSLDMKGQLSVVMSLLKNNKSKKKIGLMVTSDEEIGGMCCCEILKDYNPKLAVVPDGGKNFELIIEEKGLLQLEITAYGVTAHASEPYKGNNPLLILMSLYENLLDIYKLPKSASDFVTSINLSKLNGGDANNMVPSKATMVLDIRYTKENPPEVIINDIKALCDDIEIKVIGRDSMFQVDVNLDVIKDFIKSSEKVLGREIVLKKCVATSDAVYFSEKNIPTILMNPVGDFWHGPLEYVEIDSLYSLYKIFKNLI